MSTARCGETPDFSLRPLGNVTRSPPRPAEIRRINKAVVLCAENLVISSQKLPSLEGLTKKYAAWRIDVDIVQDKVEDTYLFGMHTRVRRAAL